MALMRNRPGAVARRITMWSLIVDVVAGLFIGVAITQVLGLIVFVIGLAVTAMLYYNFRQVARTRGTRF